jgi:hypothetical protein
VVFRQYLRQFIAERYATRSFGFFIGGLCVALNLSERRVFSSPLNPLVEMDRPTNPNYLTDEELMAIAAGAGPNDGIDGGPQGADCQTSPFRRFIPR